MLIRSVVVLSLFVGASALLWRGWPALRPWFHQSAAQTPQSRADATARTEPPGTPAEGGAAPEPIGDGNVPSPTVTDRGRSNDAAFAPRHTRRTIELAAYLESMEPLPPGVRPLSPSADPDGPTEHSGPEQVGLSTDPAQQTPASTALSEFVPLLNGVNLQGWEVHEGNAQAWQVVEGVLRCGRGGGGWLRTTQDYSDFELRFDYRLSPGANTGVGLRLPEVGSPTATGLEVQLLDDAAPKYAHLRPDQYTGSVYYHVPARKRLSLPTGEWHACRLLVQGDHLRIWINEQLVNEVDLRRSSTSGTGSPLADRPPLGRVGLQSSAAPVEFRNVLLRDLLTTLPSGLRFTDLEPGDGETCPPGATVTVDYLGRLPDGRTVDSTLQRGTPATLALSQTIAGWQQGVPGMRVGGRRKLIVPPHLGYGPAGVPNRIPPQATLVFEVELRAVAH